ncbi:hypothetical protein [Domibacillus tundrae]|uniref:hypothetical protein n=1 Tax=Domibacillus tundrae TaxID=1587527 RepID=UPI000617FF08|nr:hypothetical protein [Domibacillus tundrae]
MTKIAALLSTDVKKKLAAIGQKKEVPKAAPPKRKKRYSTREIEELMGKNMTTSKRVSGRIRSINRK